MKNTVKLFKALGDPTRLRILKLLEHGELCVCHLTATLGMGQSRISRHLSILARAGLIDVRREGKWAYYRMGDGGTLRRIRACHAGLEKDRAVTKDRKSVLESRPRALCPMPPRKKPAKE